jgi:hypothetical protein
VVALLVRGDRGDPDGPYARRTADGIASFCAFYHCLPRDVDELTPEMLSAMVRHMRAEAAAIEAASRKKR